MKHTCLSLSCLAAIVVAIGCGGGGTADLGGGTNLGGAQTLSNVQNNSGTLNQTKENVTVQVTITAVVDTHHFTVTDGTATMTLDVKHLPAGQQTFTVGDVLTVTGEVATDDSGNKELDALQVTKADGTVITGVDGCDHDANGVGHPFGHDHDGQGGHHGGHDGQDDTTTGGSTTGSTASSQ